MIKTSVDFLKPEVCETKILPTMLRLANAHQDDYRTEAVTLMAKIIPRLGQVRSF